MLQRTIARLPEQKFLVNTFLLHRNITGLFKTFGSSHCFINILLNIPL